MSIQKSSSIRWLRFKEVLLMTLIGALPSILFGVAIRRALYRHIFKSIGKGVYFQEGVEFTGVCNVELGDGVHLFRDVRIDGGWTQNKICIGNQVALERGVSVGALENTTFEIGERTFIGPHTCITGPGDITIGKNCLIAGYSGIIANNHNLDDLTLDIRDQGVTRKGITIEDNCWIGHGVTVLDGVTIGQGSVIGAGAVVTKDIPSNSIAVGVPAQVIRQRGATSEALSQTASQLSRGSAQNCFKMDL